ncbi:unnamed protein product [Arctogadus glacialis]
MDDNMVIVIFMFRPAVCSPALTYQRMPRDAFQHLATVRSARALQRHELCDEAHALPRLKRRRHGRH